MANEKRLIDANVLKELILRRSGNMKHSWSSAAVLLAVECQPNVDAVEVVRGRWRRVFDDSAGWVDMCSKCKEFGDGTLYCPNCGAKMGVERKEGE